jgi:hypothetical protein
MIQLNFAIPRDADDEIAFTTIDLIMLGTQTYFAIMFFLMYGYNYLAQHYYSLNDLDKFNKYISTLSYQIKNYESILFGLGNEDGLINNVIDILKKIKQLTFIKNEREDILYLIVKAENALNQIKFGFKKIKKDANFLEKKPNFNIEYDFTSSNISTPLGIIKFILQNFIFS